MGVVQSHLRFFISIFIVHVMDDVHGIGIQFRQPGAVCVQQRRYPAVLQILALIGRMHRADLHVLHLVPATVEGQEQQLWQIDPRAEKLHVFTQPHG